MLVGVISSVSVSILAELTTSTSIISLPATHWLQPPGQISNSIHLQYIQNNPASPSFLPNCWTWIVWWTWWNCQLGQQPSLLHSDWQTTSSANLGRWPPASSYLPNFPSFLIMWVPLSKTPPVVSMYYLSCIFNVCSHAQCVRIQWHQPQALPLVSPIAL